MDTSSIVRAEAEIAYGMPITDVQWKAVLPVARRKLDTIIRREGDDGGERNKPYYLGFLVAELLTASDYSEESSILADLKTNPICIACGKCFLQTV